MPAFQYTFQNYTFSLQVEADTSPVTNGPNKITLYVSHFGNQVRADECISIAEHLGGLGIVELGGVAYMRQVALSAINSRIQTTCIALGLMTAPTSPTPAPVSSGNVYTDLITALGTLTATPNAAGTCFTVG